MSDLPRPWVISRRWARSAGLPGRRTSSRSQVRTSMLPLRLETSTSPRAPSGRVSSMGVAASAGAAMPARASGMNRRIMGGTPWSGLAQGQVQAVGVDALQAVEQVQRVGITGERGADLGRATLEFGIEPGRQGGGAGRGAGLAQRALVFEGEGIGGAQQRRGGGRGARGRGSGQAVAGVGGP